MDAVVVGGDFDAQLGYLAETARHIRDRFSDPADRIDNGDCVCSDHRLFPVNTLIFVIKSDIGPCGTLIRFHSVRLRLIALPLVTGDGDQWRVADRSGPHL